jgi:hypothetical protein
VRDLTARVDRWLFAPGAGSQVWALRTGLAALFAVRLVFNDYRDLAGQPPALFRPPPLWRWLDQMPSADVLVLVQVVGAGLAVLAVLRVLPRLTFPGAWLCFVFLEGLIASRAKIQHNELLPILAAVPLLAAPAEVTWRDHEPRARHGWPARVALVVVAGTYFFCGLAKVVSSGPSWVLSDNMRWVLASGARSSRPSAPELAQFIADHDLLAHAIAFASLGLELTFLVVLFRPRTRPWYALAAVALHTGIWFTLGLDYWSWVVTVVLVLLPWDRVLAQIRSASRATSPSSSRTQAT